MTSCVLVRSFAKINLALAVLGPREDGYHEIRTVLQTIDLHDILEIRPSSALELECEGLEDVPLAENLVWRAATRLRREYPGAGARITLRKKIPRGSGLGGGSSNAAAALLGLIRLWGVDVPPARLRALAAGLGADVPFFLSGGTALGIGRGDEVYPLPDLPTCNVVVIYPGMSIPTAEAYAMLDRRLTPEASRDKIWTFCSLLEAGSVFLDGVFNDFERVVPAAHGAVREARDFLTEHGATAALLSGSGSSVFGFFRTEESALAASSAIEREAWRVFPAKTLCRSGYFQRLFGPSE
ncbi:MAG: 4-(cytidine 5'-diphospho)-2-C-methyl-D-erythritol kinase [Acidobacteria bacterium]|nr:4-(cytidine 5'-diphospho)-2-C-methyl-D-erythritol kinase [Acidobacteriota bacterium]